MATVLNLRGVQLELHENEALSNHIRRENDFYEAHILDWITDNIGYKQLNILDVGANIGNHTLYMASFWQYEYLYAFEALPQNYEVLKRNIAPYSPFVSAINVALTDTVGDRRIHMDRHNMGASCINDGWPDGEVVPGIPLDLLDFCGVSFMKVDIEGHEPFFLKGAQKTILKNRPMILIEDINDEYAQYLPDGYELIKAWIKPEHTYLYKWGKLC